MQSEKLVEEFSRLVREYKQDDGPGGIEAWNLIADFAVDNAEAIEAALSAAEPQPAPSVAVKAVAPVDIYKAVGSFIDNDTFDKDHVSAICRAIASALSAQVQDVAGWRPIETAPKDGTPVILWTVWLGDEISPDPFSEVQIGYWDPGNGLPESHDFSRRPEWVVQRIGEPTHWMPLPAAPAKQEG